MSSGREGAATVSRGGTGGFGRPFVAGEGVLGRGGRDISRLAGRGGGVLVASPTALRRAGGLGHGISVLAC